MNSLSVEIQKALAECREELSASICREQKLRKENDKLKEQLLSLKEDVNSTNLTLVNESDLWREECIRMQNSFSWRITKPLRLIKKFVYSLRTVGFRLTFSKIANRWK